MFKDDTIAAISTAYGESGIGIVRMSGPDSLSIASSVFTSKLLKPRYMYHGFISDGNKTLDEVLAVYFKAPYSYTAEDMVEIQCHGSLISVKNILSLLISKGARLADKGEFTKRAFLNGRIDLSQSEAVIDAIRAKTDKFFDAALFQLQGNLSSKIKSIRDRLKDLLINITVNMDYPDEDIEEITYNDIFSCLSGISSDISDLINSSHEGRLLREGISAAIVGKPNVGKSSLMNLLLNESRSIVSSIPGTTRDTIIESASVNGIPVSFTDTAGIHSSSDIVESLGIEKSKDAFNRADLLIIVLDSSMPLDDEDIIILKMAEDRKSLIILNKSDLPRAIDDDDLRQFSGSHIIYTSFLNDKDLNFIKDSIERIVVSENFHTEENLLVTNVRHIDLLKKSFIEIEEALSAVKSFTALDFIEINCKAAFDYLGEITGETASGEIIDEIFSRFCLGK